MYVRFEHKGVESNQHAHQFEMIQWFQIILEGLAEFLKVQQINIMLCLPPDMLNVFMYDLVSQGFSFKLRLRNGMWGIDLLKGIVFWFID